MKEHYRKESPILSLLGLGGGAGGNLGGGGGLVVSGGTLEPGGIQPGNGEQYHVFTAPGNLVITGGDISVDFLMVGGGGGGSGGIGGGGSTNNIYNPSDERLKENMVELTDGLDKIKKLKPYSFTWKKGFDENLDGVTQYGFGAHQAKTVDEKLVEKFIECDIELDGETIKDPLRVNEKHVLPLLVKAIQEQQEQIETLKSEIAALKGS